MLKREIDLFRAVTQVLSAAVTARIPLNYPRTEDSV